jgi:Ca2+-binding RTX toxin-like protein
MASGTINLTLFDANNDPLTLALLSNSNTSLVPNANVVLGGSGNARTITVTGAAQKSGTAKLTFKLSDGTKTVSIIVTVKVGTDGNEFIHGTDGIDMIFGLNGTNKIEGDSGNDLLCGGNGNDTLNGEDGNDILSGGNGNDVLNGGSGNDILDGGNGNDILHGNPGSDKLTGGSGADFFSGGADSDTATDFTPSQGDTTDGTIP